MYRHSYTLWEIHCPSHTAHIIKATDTDTHLIVQNRIYPNRVDTTNKAFVDLFIILLVTTAYYLTLTPLASGAFLFDVLIITGSPYLTLCDLTTLSAKCISSMYQQGPQGCHQMVYHVIYTMQCIFRSMPKASYF